jgi:P27 family predicted phage terminase small subunit
MPKRTSTKEKKLSGTYRQDRAKPALVSVPMDAKPQSGLDSIGLAEYQRIHEAYASTGRLTALDQTILCLYASAYSAWRRAEQSLREDGELVWIEVRNTHGKVTHRKPMVSPHIRLAATAARAVHRYGDALGLSPASRVKQGVQFEDEQKKTSGGGLLAQMKKEAGEN